jgi:hypothetical protein
MTRAAARPQTKSKLELSFKFLVVNAIDERIVTTVAHSKPIAAEPDDVNIMVPIYIRENVLQHIVSLQRQPAKRKQSNYYHKHLDNLLLILH